MNSEKNTMRDMKETSYSDSQFNKSSEINEGMSIVNNSCDEYENKTRNVMNGGAIDGE